MGYNELRKHISYLDKVYKKAQRDNKSFYFDVEDFSILAYNYFRRNDRERAQNLIIQAKKIFPHSVQILVLDAIFLTKEKKYCKAINLIEKVKTLGIEQDIEVDFLLALIYKLKGDHTSYFNLVKKLYKKGDNYQKGFFAFEISDLFFLEGDVENALKYREKGLWISPKREDEFLDYLQFCETHNQINRFNSFVNKILIKDPKNRYFNYLKARTLYTQKKYKESLNQLEKIDSENDYFSEIYEFKVLLLAINGHKTKAKQEVLDIQYVSECEDEIAYFVGKTYFELDDFKSAAIFFEKALEMSLFPSKKLLRILVFSYMKLGNISKMRKLISQFHDDIAFNESFINQIKALIYDEQNANFLAAKYYKKELLNIYQNPFILVKYFQFLYRTKGLKKLLSFFNLFFPKNNPNTSLAQFLIAHLALKSSKYNLSTYFFKLSYKNLTVKHLYVLRRNFPHIIKDLHTHMIPKK